MVFVFNWFVKLTAGPLWLLCARTKVHYADKSVQSRKLRGKAIIMPNHTDIWDFSAMLFLFPGRTLRCVVAELMYEKNSFLTFLLRGMGTIRVDRNINDFAFLEKCKAILDKNGVVEFYPEARLPRPWEKELLPFKPSITLLALETGAPIIPVYTDGNYYTRERNHIIIGTPIDVRQYYDESRSEKENMDAITDMLRGKLNELKDRLCQEVSAG